MVHYSRIKKICKSFSPDLLIGTSFILPLLSRRLRIPFLNFDEDDAYATPLYARISFPFSTYIVAPYICQLGKWESKKIGYNGYHELAFLRPEQFTPSEEVASKYIDLSKKNFLLRLTAFDAHHDYGKRGINLQTSLKTVNYLEQHGNVIISSEKPLDAAFDKHRLIINPNDIHHVMAHCSLIIGDSQSMAMEAACLGIPSIRLNDYVERISVLEELEKTYKLTHGFTLKQKSEFTLQIKNIVENPDSLLIYQRRKEQMLNDKINVGGFIYWLIKEFPASIEQAKDLRLMKEKFGGTIPPKHKFKLKRGKNKRFFILFSFYFLILFLLYIIPLEGELKLNQYEYSGFRLDHISHFLVFCPLVFVVAPIFLRETRFRKLKIISTSFLVAVLFEVIHLTVPYRAFNIEDLIANLIGVSLGIIMFLLYRRKT